MTKPHRNGVRHRCVVWHPPRVPPPERLISSLKRRDLDLTMCEDPFMTVAQVCLSIPEQGHLILVLVDPENLQDRHAVVEELEMRDQRLAVWRYDETSQEPLAAHHESKPQRDEPTELPQPNAPTGKPTLRLIGAPVQEQERPSPDDDDEPRDPFGILSAAELAMLLSPDEPPVPPRDPERDS